MSSSTQQTTIIKTPAECGYVGPNVRMIYAVTKDNDVQTLSSDHWTEDDTRTVMYWAPCDTLGPGETPEWHVREYTMTFEVDITAIARKAYPVTVSVPAGTPMVDAESLAIEMAEKLAAKDTYFRNYEDHIVEVAAHKLT